MTRESDYDQTIIDMSHAYGWRCVHFRPGMTSRFRINKKGESKPVWTTPVSGDAAGFPDWMFFKPGEKPIFIEFKVGRNKPSPEQEEWLDLLNEVPGIQSGLLILPDDLDRLEELLKE